MSATTSSNNKKSIAFFGATTGCGLSALRRALADGHTCRALCRTPSKLTALFPADSNPNLTVLSGNAHDSVAVAECLTASTTNIVDCVIFSIGGKFIASRMTLDDPDVCKRGVEALLAALAALRSKGMEGRPRLLVVSTTGISSFGRDVPVALLPMYKTLLRVPHADKKVMEERVVASGEAFTVVRPSLLVDGEKAKEIRVGVEDPVEGRESAAVRGFTISRDDVGRWMYENLVRDGGDKYVGKIVMITY